MRINRNASFSLTSSLRLPDVKLHDRLYFMHYINFNRFLYKGSAKIFKVTNKIALTNVNLITERFSFGKQLRKAVSL